MTIIHEIADIMQEVLTTTSYDAAKESGFVQRQSKISGSVFVQTLVFGFLADADATVHDLAQTAESLGTDVTDSGLFQRCTEKGAECLRLVFLYVSIYYTTIISGLPNLHVSRLDPLLISSLFPLDMQKNSTMREGGAPSVCSPLFYTLHSTLYSAGGTASASARMIIGRYKVVSVLAKTNVEPSG